jgi:secondary thiamine-phosphate synthase enzyme
VVQLLRRGVHVRVALENDQFNEATMPVSHAKNSGRSVTGELALRTDRRTQLLDVTAGVTQMVHDSGVRHGVCYVYVLHTTAGIIINEAADPDVARDIEMSLDRLIPKSSDYRHSEGNSDSHVNCALTGTSATIFIADGRLELGRWQGIFFCEFDGPRERKLKIKIVAD